MVVRGSDEALSIGVTASAEAPGASGPDWGRSSGDKGGIEAGLGREPGPGGDLTPSLSHLVGHYVDYLQLRVSSYKDSILGGHAWS